MMHFPFHLSGLLRALRVSVVNLFLRHGCIVGLLLLICGGRNLAFGQDQPPPDPLRDAALKPELQEEAKKPLPRPGKTAAGWEETLAPVFQSIQSIPAETVEEAAYEFRRARVRMTADERKKSHQEFRWLRDFDRSPELYFGKPVALHGYLTKLQPLPASKDAEDAEQETHGYEGRLKVWNDDRSVSFVIAKLPKGLPRGENLHEPGSIIGYLFRVRADADSEKPAEPLVVARWVRWYRPALDADSLANVKDRTLHIQDEEYEPYFRTLLHAKLVDFKAQQKLARDFWEKRQKSLKRPRPLFVDLFKTMLKNPRIYRGQAVTMTGTLRKLTVSQADPLNSFCIQDLYEGWIFAEDSQSNPTVVVFTEKPDDLPKGEKLSVPVQVTGYVFKLYGYEAQDGKRRLAPMLLAKTMQKLVIPEPEPFPLAWVGAGFAVLCLGVLLFFWSAYRGDKQFQQKQTAIEQAGEPPKFDNLPVDEKDQ